MMLLALAIALAVVTAVGVGVLAWDQRRTPMPSDAGRVPNRHAAIAAAAAWACYLGAFVAGIYGVLFVNVSVQGLPLGGRTIAVAPAAAGLVFLVVHAAGDLTWPRPRGSVREARLAPRDADDVAPRWLHRVVLVSAAALVTGMVFLGSAADGPRTLVVTTSEGIAYRQGPFPGWWHGVPVIIAVALLIGALEGVLRLIALRPAVTGVPGAWDMALRRRSARRVLRGVQCSLALTGAGIFHIAGMLFDQVGPGMEPAYVACVAIAWLFGLSALMVLVVPGLDFRAARREAAQAVAVGA